MFYTQKTWMPHILMWFGMQWSLTVIAVFHLNSFVMELSWCDIHTLCKGWTDNNNTMYLMSDKYILIWGSRWWPILTSASINDNSLPPGVSRHNFEDILVDVCLAIKHYTCWTIVKTNRNLTSLINDNIIIHCLIYNTHVTCLCLTSWPPTAPLVDVIMT